MVLLSFSRFFRQLSPLKRSHGQQGAGTLGVCEWRKPIALCRLTQAIFTEFHFAPQTEIRAVTQLPAPKTKPNSSVVLAALSYARQRLPLLLRKGLPRL